MDPRIFSHPALTLAGMAMRVKPQGKAPGQLWDEFGPRMGELQHLVGPDVTYGLSDTMDMATGEFEYMAGIQVSSTADLPAGMVARSVPPPSNILTAPLDDAVQDLSRFVLSLPPETVPLHAWGPKEVLAHLVFYHELYVHQIEAFLADSPIDLPKGRYSDLNAAAVQHFQNLEVDELAARLRLANRRLDELYAAGDPEEIFVSIKQGVRPYRLDKLIPAVASHIRSHLRELRKDFPHVRP